MIKHSKLCNWIKWKYLSLNNFLAELRTQPNFYQKITKAEKKETHNIKL